MSRTTSVSGLTDMTAPLIFEQLIQRVDAAEGTAALQLPDYEVAHDLRRAVLKGQEEGVTA
ncbi:MAG: hypothetical protein CM15mP74_07390 [Halieaceae bacterium]|nr:MAG: hypothetical protein CM15mP74_07390 [Halieaceae bacterium]